TRELRVVHVHCGARRIEGEELNDGGLAGNRGFEYGAAGIPGEIFGELYVVDYAAGEGTKKFRHRSPKLPPGKNHCTRAPEWCRADIREPTDRGSYGTRSIRTASRLSRVARMAANPRSSSAMSWTMV